MYINVGLPVMIFTKFIVIKIQIIVYIYMYYKLVKVQRGF